MDDQLKQLYDYTKFHIGMYTTLVASIIGVFGNVGLKGQYIAMVPYIKGSVLLFVLAGMAGGLIASSIPSFSKFDDFRNARLGPWHAKWIPAIWCTHIEHTAFWFGCSSAVVGLLIVL